MSHLFSTCLLSDGYHWLLIAVGGEILASSECGFASLNDAVKDFYDRFGR